MGRSLACLAAAAAALTGCGDDEDNGSGATLTVRAGSSIQIVGDEYSFDPDTVVVKGTEGRATLRISLRNAGTLAHNLRVLRGDRDVGGTSTFTGGETRSARVTFGPGSYQLVCTVGDHAELGMVGTLEVQ